MIRHTETNYNNLVKTVAKDQARFYVSPIVNSKIDAAKGTRWLGSDKGKNKCWHCGHKLEVIKGTGKQYSVQCTGSDVVCGLQGSGPWAATRDLAIAEYLEMVDGYKENILVGKIDTRNRNLTKFIFGHVKDKVLDFSEWHNFGLLWERCCEESWFDPKVVKTDMYRIIKPNEFANAIYEFLLKERHI
jgi:hypothetical protein